MPLAFVLDLSNVKYYIMYCILCATFSEIMLLSFMLKRMYWCVQGFQILFAFSAIPLAYKCAFICALYFVNVLIFYFTCKHIGIFIFFFINFNTLFYLPQVSNIFYFICVCFSIILKLFQSMLTLIELAQ